MEKIVLDTNILIEILKGNQETVTKVQSFENELCISAITVMELFYGAINKAEVKKLENFILLFTVIHTNENISRKAINLVKQYAKSHTLDIPDSIIASTALTLECKLFTYNTKDFKYIDNLILIA